MFHLTHIGSTLTFNRLSLIRFFSLLPLFLLVNLNNAKSQLHSQLWGKNGENWDRSKLPDFTTSGYRSGRASIPNYPVWVNVMDLGAKGNGVHDDTKALKQAIKNCKAMGSVYLPEGKYLITDSLLIQKSNINIKGAGQGKTILIFKNGLEEIYPNYNKEWPNQTKWSWSGAMILFQGNINSSGIQDLTIKFPDSLYAGHNFHERAYNGIGFSEKAHDGWIENVTFTNCDVGIWIDSSAHHITARNWLLNFEKQRASQKISGHHGLNIYGGYNLIEEFEISGRFVHDLSVESDKSVYNVFHNGKGTDLCIDHHNHEQSHNLFSNLDAGLGTRLFQSGGKETPRGVCFNETYWNIRADRNMQYCDQFDSKELQSKNNICVGIKTQIPTNLKTPTGNWFETIDPTQLIPKDIYQAQMELKRVKVRPGVKVK